MMDTKNKELSNFTCDIKTGVCGPVSGTTENKSTKGIFELVDLANLKEEVKK